MQQLSMIMLSYLIFGYSCATSAQLWRNRPSPNFLLKKKRQQWVSVTLQKPPILQVKKEFLLHDIGLVNGCDFVSALFCGIIEGKLGNTSGFFSGNYLQTLNYPCNTLKKPKTHAIYKTAIPTLYYRSED